MSLYCPAIGLVRWTYCGSIEDCHKEHPTTSAVTHPKTSHHASSLSREQCAPTPLIPPAGLASSHQTRHCCLSTLDWTDLDGQHQRTCWTSADFACICCQDAGFWRSLLCRVSFCVQTHSTSFWNLWWSPLPAGRDPGTPDPRFRIHLPFWIVYRSRRWCLALALWFCPITLDLFLGLHKNFHGFSYRFHLPLFVQYLSVLTDSLPLNHHYLGDHFMKPN